MSPVLFASRAQGPASPGRGKRARRRSGKAGSAENRKACHPSEASAAQPDHGCAVLDVSGAFQQSLGPALKLQTRILMGLATGERGDPLHEIEQAFRRAAFLPQDGLDDLCRLRF
jgi:hypothetical protein